MEDIGEKRRKDINRERKGKEMREKEKKMYKEISEILNQERKGLSIACSCRSRE